MFLVRINLQKPGALNFNSPNLMFLFMSAPNHFINAPKMSRPEKCFFIMANDDIKIYDVPSRSLLKSCVLEGVKMKCNYPAELRPTLDSYRQPFIPNFVMRNFLSLTRVKIGFKVAAKSFSPFSFNLMKFNSVYSIEGENCVKFYKV